MILKNEFVYCRDRTIPALGAITSKYKIPNSIFDKIVNECDKEYYDSAESEPEVETNLNMTEITTIEFLRLAAQTINKPFNGDPLSLTSFINSIKLLQTVATTANLQTLLQTFILTRLESKALEAIPQNPASIEAIIEIRPDNSKVVEGRLLALKNAGKNMIDFAKEAENLADAFKRALIVEGVSDNKANEMTIDKTIEMCRQSTQSALVKAVVSSAKFDQPKDVIAKFITETNNEKKEHQVLSFKTRGNSNYYNNNNRGNFSRNNYFKQNNRYGQNNGNQQQRRYQNGSNPNYNGRGHIRGNFRGNYQNNFRGNNARYQRQNNEGGPSVRYTENSVAPRETLRGTSEI